MYREKTFRFKMLIAFLAFAMVFVLTVCGFIFLASNYASSKESSTRFETVTASMPTVIIDAGHGGEDGGAIGVDGSYEKDINLCIAKKLADLLASRGITTVMTRSEDTLLYDKNADHEGRKKALDLAQRLKIADSYEDAIFVSIHMNSFTQSKYKGLQVYYSPNNTRSATLAQEIQSLYKSRIMPENQRQIKESGGKIALLDKIQIPSVLVECGFISNPEECAKLNDDSYQNELATMICDAIYEHLNQCENQNRAQTEN